MLAWQVAPPCQELCRWPSVGMAKEKDARAHPRGSLEQLEKEAFRMAAGGEKGCTLASDTDLHHQLLRALERLA